MNDEFSSRSLSLRAVTPGLIVIFLVDLLTVSGLWPGLGWHNLLLTLVLVSLPWITLVVLGKPVQSLGFCRREFLRSIGWGVVAGGFWRLLSILFNLWWVDLGELGLMGIPQLVSALIWIPLVEETFFRGYLGRALSGSIGSWPGILLQAGLFTLQPAHWNQGGLALLSVLGFGVLAGWLAQRWNSLWPAWGAHAFANLLPRLVYFA